MSEFKINQQTDNSYSVEGDVTFISLNNKAIRHAVSLNFAKETNIDLSHINSADSAGLALIIEWIKQGKRRDTKLTFKNIPQQLLTLAKLSGLEINEYLN